MIYFNFGAITLANCSHGDRHLGMGACFHGNFFCYIPDGLVIHASNS